TPGYADFVGEAKAGLRTADAALIAVDASSGVQVGTESAWSYAEEVGAPRAFFVGRIDRENADFDRVVSGLQETFGNKCVPVLMPIGAHESFAGVVDLVTMKAYMGEKGTEAPIPPELEAAIATYRDKLIEAVAEADDDVINKYL